MAGTIPAINRRFLFSLSMLTVIHFMVSVSAILDPTDFLALQSIRKSLDDLPGSGFFSSWDFTGDPCDFSGVFCLEDRVVGLTLGDPVAGTPGLTGRISPSIGTMSALTELSLVPGRVTGPIPTSIGRLVDLRFLALSRNFLTGVIPASISALQNLTTLDLSFNRLSGEVPSILPPNLVNLILAHNNLSGDLPSSSLSSTTPLIRLDLKHNSLSGDIISPLPTSLQYLSLSYNNLSGEIDTFLEPLSSLNNLDLSFNQFSGQIPDYLFTFPLTSLHLQRNNFSGKLKSPNLPPLPIQTVDLSYNKLTGPIPPALSTVQNLYLNNNKFEGEVPTSFVENLMTGSNGGGMQVLYLQHNFLTGIEIRPTAEIPVTSEVCLQYNCMVPPVQTPCPDKSGPMKSRPIMQCVEWRTGSGPSDDSGDDR